MTERSEIALFVHVPNFREVLNDAGELAGVLVQVRSSKLFVEPNES